MRLPIELSFQLGGWSLFWARLEPTSDAGSELESLRFDLARAARESLQLGTLSAHPAVAGLRALFRAAGCDPTRYRPSSEALLRRVLKGDEIPAISPLVDINNCLSLSLAVPCCVMSEESVDPPFVLRVGEPGESYESLRGPFNLESRPLLADRDGPCDAPITGSQRVKVTTDTAAAWLVAYLPRGVVSADEAEASLIALLDRAPVARITATERFPGADPTS